MATILFAWELGSNLGHLSRDLPLARTCRDAGHHVVVAASHLTTTVDVMGNEGFTLLQAPMLKPSFKRKNPPVNYPDMLLHEGYDNAASLAAAITGWQGLMDLVRPSALVYNHAPTALLAARTRDIPVMVIGTGFEIPPTLLPNPSFRPWERIPQQFFEEAEAFALSQINVHLLRAGKNTVARVSELFASSATYLTTFPELDPFGPRANVDYIGPIYALPDAPVVEWSVPATKRRVFAYLRPAMQSFVQILETLQNLDAEVICAIPGVSAELRDQFSRLRIYPHAVDLKYLLTEVDGVVTSGVGTIATALLAGTPVCVVPQVVEQYLGGLPLERIGAGVLLRKPASVTEFSASMNRLLTLPGYRQGALAFVQRHREFDVMTVTSRLFADLESL